MAMKSQVNCICLALIATAATVMAAPDMYNCSTQYQVALQQVVDIKKRCPDTIIKDYCEVCVSTNTLLSVTWACKRDPNAIVLGVRHCQQTLSEIESVLQEYL